MRLTMSARVRGPLSEFESFRDLLAVATCDGLFCLSAVSNAAQHLVPEDSSTTRQHIGPADRRLHLLLDQPQANPVRGGYIAAPSFRDSDAGTELLWQATFDRDPSNILREMSETFGELEFVCEWRETTSPHLGEGAVAFHEGTVNYL